MASETFGPGDLEAIRDALHLAHRDIGEWMQLGRRWQEESPDYGRDPKCPTDAGMASSERARRKIGAALAAIARVEGREG